MLRLCGSNPPQRGKRISIEPRVLTQAWAAAEAARALRFAEGDVLVLVLVLSGRL
jgi:hypothetical protein